jgi:hypothetical protein
MGDVEPTFEPRALRVSVGSGVSGIGFARQEQPYLRVEVPHHSKARTFVAGVADPLARGICVVVCSEVLVPH